jgi:polyferredoxin
MHSNIKIYFTGIRNIVQLCFLILTLAIGLHFFLFVFQASSDGNITVSRPPGVEAFLPIGGLMGWKLFITEGIWDQTHPAAMVILGFAMFIALLFKKSFCGWTCPVGTISEWAWKTGEHFVGRNIRIPKLLDFPLSGIKYLLLGFFLFIILSMQAAEIEAFLESPYYKMTDVKMLFFFTHMSITTSIILIALFAASLIIKNFWCRYLCPYGGLLGLLALISPIKIQRDKTRCINCGKCAAKCPYNLPVNIKMKISSPECNGCLECVNACPVEKTLQMKGFKTVITSSGLAMILTLLFILTVYTAQVTGHWKSNVSEHEFFMRLPLLNTREYTHPGINK